MGILDTREKFIIAIFDDGSEEIFCVECDDEMENSTVVYQDDGYMYCQECQNKVMWRPKWDAKLQ